MKQIDDMAQAYAALDKKRNALNDKQQYRTVYLVRHGSTDLNAQDKIRGWSNIPLSNDGWEEVFALAKKMKNVKIGIIFSSDLDRSVGTASAIGASVGAPVDKTPLLRPWNLGQLTGQPSEDVHPHIRMLAEQMPDQAVAGGESFNTFRNRAFSGLRFCLANSRGKPICMVTHHRVERLLEAWTAKGQPANGDIDFDVMFQKGDPPAYAEKVTLYLPHLAGAQPTSAYAGASVIGPGCIGGK